MSVLDLLVYISLRVIQAVALIGVLCLVLGVAQIVGDAIDYHFRRAALRRRQKGRGRCW